MRKTGWPVMGWILLALWVSGCSTEEGVLSRLGPEDALAQIEARRGDPAFVILDVQTPQEFAQDHLPDAVNMDFYGASFWDDVDLLARDAAYLVYCKSGRRSSEAVARMRAMGFREVFDIEGGLAALRVYGESSAGSSTCPCRLP